MSAVIDQSDEFSQRMSHGMNKFHTLLHRSKNITLLFSGDSALFAKNTGVGSRPGGRKAFGAATTA